MSEREPDLTVSAPTYEALQKHARQHSTTPAEIVEMVVREFLDAHASCRAGTCAGCLPFPIFDEEWFS